MNKININPNDTRTNKLLGQLINAVNNVASVLSNSMYMHTTSWTVGTTEGAPLDGSNAWTLPEGTKLPTLAILAGGLNGAIFYLNGTPLVNNTDYTMDIAAKSITLSSGTFSDGDAIVTLF